MTITLVGFQYHSTDDYVNSLTSEKTLTLKRDEGNAYDNKAIGVYDDDRLVAYVKKEDAHNLWNTAKEELSCTIVEDLGNVKKAQLISNIRDGEVSKNRNKLWAIKSLLVLTNLSLAIWAGNWATDGPVGDTFLYPVVFIIVFVIVGFPALGWMSYKIQKLQDEPSPRQVPSCEIIPQHRSNRLSNISDSQNEKLQGAEHDDTQTSMKIDKDFEISEANFFGLDLYSCPNEEWTQILERVEEGKTEYQYQKDEIKCTLKINESENEKTYIFNIPYSYENYLNLGYCIEKNIIKKRELRFTDFLEEHELRLETLQSEDIACISFNNSKHMIAYIANPPIIVITIWLDYHKRTIADQEDQKWKENDFRINIVEKDLEGGKLVCFSQSGTSIVNAVPTQLVSKYRNKTRYSLTEEVWNIAIKYSEKNKYTVLDPYNPEIFSETKSFAYNLTKGDPDLEATISLAFEPDGDGYSFDLWGDDITAREKYLYSNTTIKYNYSGEEEYTGFDILDIVVLKRFSFENIEEVRQFLNKKKEDLNNADEFESFLIENKIAYSKFTSEEERLSKELIGMF